MPNAIVCEPALLKVKVPRFVNDADPVKKSNGVGNVLVTSIVAVGLFGYIYSLSRRQPIHADNVNAPIPRGARSALAIDREGEFVPVPA